MSRRKKLGWNVSASVFEDHEDWAKDVYGKTDGKYAVAVEEAMKEFMDADRYAPVEEAAEDVLDALSLDGGAKKREIEGHPVGERTRTLGHRVDVDLKTEFSHFAREELDTRPGIALSHALHQHYPHGGGRDRRTRLLDKLDAIKSAVEGRSAVRGDEKVEAIADHLDESFRLSEFVEAVEEAVGVETRRYGIQKFLPDVLDQTEKVPHPIKSQVFLPRTAKYAPENPNPANLPYHAINDEEKRVALQVAGVRKAWSKGGQARLSVEEGVDTLAGEGSPRRKTVRSVMREAATFDGFRFDDRNDPGLKVNVDHLDTQALNSVIAIAGEELRAERDDEVTDGDTDETDANPGVDTDDSGSTDSETAVEAEMDQLTAATPVADGGDGGGES